jgi:hypothetical protein
LHTIEWVSCYQSHQCARLIIPQDAQNATPVEFVTIALIRLPAVVSIQDPRHGGFIITNPGLSVW